MTYTVWQNDGKVRYLLKDNIPSADLARHVALRYTRDGQPAYIEKDGVLKYVILYKMVRNRYAYICVTIEDMKNRDKDKYAYISKKTGKLYR